MKRILLTLAAVLVCAAPALAQPRMAPPKVTTLTGLRGNQGDIVNLVGTGDYLCYATTCTTSTDWKIITSGAASGAPTDATYITQTANATLSAEQALASLATGLMNSATTTGVVTTLAPTDDNLVVGSGSAWQLKALTTCTGAGKAVTYDASSNAFGCNTITASPTIGDTQVAYATAANTIGGSAGLTFVSPLLRDTGTFFLGPADASMDPSIAGWWGAPTPFLMNSSGNGTLAVVSQNLTPTFSPGVGDGANPAHAFGSVTLADSPYGIDATVILQHGRTTNDGGLTTFPNGGYAAHLQAGTDSSAGNGGDLYAIYLAAPSTSGGTADTYYGVYSQSVTQFSAITNPYFLWFDSAGVYRIKGDGVMGYYDPNTANCVKYAPGAQCFERVVQQWNGDTIEYGTEKGPTQTLASVTSVTTTATATLTGHGYRTGDVVTIAGAGQAEYNGAYTITRLTADTFSYTFAGSATTPATGTITAQGGTLRDVRLIGANLRWLANKFTLDTDGAGVFASTITATGAVLTTLGSATGTPDSLCLNSTTVVKNAALTCTVSSENVKHGFALIPANTEDLLKLRPMQFAYNDAPDRLRWGFGAQQVASVNPALADGWRADGQPWSLDQNAILALTVKTVQELEARIRVLEAR